MTSPPVPRLKKMVEYILDENPKYRGVQARNSDIALTILIWQRWYSVGTNEDSVVHLYRLFDLPREDNVKRVRAVFQNTEHKYLPTSLEVLKKRGIEREYWEDALGYKLTTDEIRTHHQTVKENTPRQIEPILEEAPMPTMIQSAIFKGRTISPAGFQTGKEYELVLEKLQMGKPIKILAPEMRSYPNYAAFLKQWKPV